MGCWLPRRGWATPIVGQIGPETFVTRSDFERSSWLLGATVSLLGLFLVVRLAPSVGWLDGGSLTASSWVMGVAHPPGEPGYLALAKLAQLLPVGDIAFRTNLLSALALAFCALPVFVLAASLARSVSLDERLASLAGVVAAFLAVLPFGAQAQGVRAEVYALTTLLLLLALSFALAVGGRRGSAACGLLCGFALAVHPLLAVAAIPALLLARRLGRVGPLHLGWGAGASLVAAGHYLWLPLRARAVPSWSWGLPDNAQRFLDVLLARTFASNFGTEGVGPLANAEIVGLEWLRSGILAVGLVSLLAWAVLRARRRVFAYGIVALVWILGNLGTVIPQNKVYAENPDVLGYLFVGACVLAPLAALGPVWMLGEPRAPRASSATAGRRLRPAIAVVLLSLLLAWVFADGLGAGQRGNHLARRFATEQALGLPTGSVMMTSGNDTAFLWTYLQGVERRRADLVLAHRVLLGHPHEQLRIAEALADAGVPWVQPLRDSPLSVLALSPPARGFYLELRDQERLDLAEGRLQPHGLLERWMGQEAAGNAVVPSGREDLWLDQRRDDALAEFTDDVLRFDAPARQVRDYYLELHRPAETKVP